MLLTMDIICGNCETNHGDYGRKPRTGRGNRWTGKRAFHLSESDTIDCSCGCELWKWGVNGKGYAQVDKMLVTRYVLDILDEPKSVRALHRCDNPRCINPQHLYIGNQQDNMLDMYRRGRRPYYRKQE